MIEIWAFSVLITIVIAFICLILLLGIGGRK